VLPGESILEFGAGGGVWTGELAKVFGNENRLAAAIFNPDLADSTEWAALPQVQRYVVGRLEDLPAQSFDYIIGTAILCHDRYPENLGAIYRLLKAGGQILFFESNLRNPQVLAKCMVPAVGRWAGNAPCQIGISKFEFLRIASQQGFVNVEVIPYDIIHPRLPGRVIDAVQRTAFIFEHAPVIRDLCGTLYLWGRKPGGPAVRTPVNLAKYASLNQAVSVVVPCHNEEMNVGPLVDALCGYFGPYIHEILIVNDNSRDHTAQVVSEISRRNPRVRLVDREPPNGVGRALRDGYAAATGSYILTMDCDFVHIVPELRDLFDAIAEGYDGAVGSRFSPDSIMVNYPFLKTISNRTFHLLARWTLRLDFHDVSNNLKLFRADILKNLHLQQNGFAANAETGLKPIVAGYCIKEVPVSWINRTLEMGTSSFRISEVGPHYVRALWDVLRSAKLLSACAQKSPANSAAD
jgi:SAM-dependent methyltransferase